MQQNHGQVKKSRQGGYGGLLIRANAMRPDGSMKPEAIRAFLKLAKINISELARQNGVTPPWIHKVINRQALGTKTRRLIAQALGLSYRQVWGEAV